MNDSVPQSPSGAKSVPTEGDSAFEKDALAGKVAFIAGGSSGINLGIAKAYAAAGAKVSLISRSEERVQAAVAEIRDEGGEAIGMAADVRDYDALDKALAATAEKFGPVDIVVSGAAGNFLAPASQISANGFKTVVDIDLLGTFNVFRASYDHIRKPGASLIAITAGQAVHPKKRQIHACAAKAGVNMVTKCLALEWGEEGVRVNGISPGPIRGTEGMRRLTPSVRSESALQASIPLGRYGDIWDVAQMAIFLATDSARNITGSIFNCDGGSELNSASHADFTPE